MFDAAFSARLQKGENGMFKKGWLTYRIFQPLLEAFFTPERDREEFKRKESSAAEEKTFNTIH